MISWAWLIPALILGGSVAYFLLGMMTSAQSSDQDRQLWQRLVVLGYTREAMEAARQLLAGWHPAHPDDRVHKLRTVDLLCEALVKADRELK